MANPFDKFLTQEEQAFTSREEVKRVLAGNPFDEFLTPSQIAEVTKEEPRRPFGEGPLIPTGTVPITKKEEAGLEGLRGNDDFKAFVRSAGGDPDKMQFRKVENLDQMLKEFEGDSTAVKTVETLKDIGRGIVGAPAAIAQGWIDLWNIAGNLPQPFVIQWTDAEGNFSLDFVTGPEKEDIDTEINVDLIAGQEEALKGLEELTGIPAVERPKSLAGDLTGLLIDLTLGGGVIKKIGQLATKKALRKSGQEALESELDDLVGSLAKASKLEKGEDIASVVNKIKVAEKEGVTRLYDAAKKSVGFDAPVARKPLIDKWDNVVAEFGLENIPTAIAREFRRVKIGGNINIAQTEKLRKLIGNNISKLADTPQDKALILLKRSIDDAVGATISVGGNKAVAALEIARASSREFSQLFRRKNIVKAISEGRIPDRIIDRIVKTSPEAVDDLRAVRNVLMRTAEGRKAFKHLGRQTLASRLEKVITKTADFSDPAQRVKAFNKITDAIDGIGADKLKILFRGGELEALNSFRSALRTVSKLDALTDASKINRLTQTLRKRFERLMQSRLVQAGAAGGTFFLLSRLFAAEKVAEVIEGAGESE